jgi:hypothetical protein
LLDRLALRCLGLALALWPGGFIEFTVASDSVFFAYLMFFRTDAYGE